jgi:hypothetical protein
MAVGEIGDVQNPVDEGQAEGDQGIDRPQHDPVDQLLEEEDHKLVIL